MHKLIFIFLLLLLPSLCFGGGIQEAEERYGKLKKIVRYEWPQEKKWLTSVEFGAFGKGWVNKDIKDRLEQVWTLLELRGLTSEIQSFQGCYNPRPIAGTERPSFHAYGLACDFIPKDYLGYTEEFISVWRGAGWCTGERFSDPMHFSMGEC